MNTVIYGRRLQEAARDEQAGRRACWPSFKPIRDIATGTLRAGGWVHAQDIDAVVEEVTLAVVSGITTLREPGALPTFVRTITDRAVIRHIAQHHTVRVDLARAERLVAEGRAVNEEDLSAAQAAREEGRPIPSVRVPRRSVERSFEAPLGDGEDGGTYSLADTIPVRDNVAETSHLEEMMDWAREATTPRRFKAWHAVEVSGYTNGEVAEALATTPNGVAQLVRAAMADFAAKSADFPFAA